MTNVPVTTTDQMVEDFLAGIEFESLPVRKRLIFAIDATASRQPTWDLASPNPRCSSRLVVTAVSTSSWSITAASAR